MSDIDPLAGLDTIGWMVVGAALAVLWLLLVLLPFAVFGTKRRIDRLSDQLEAIHEELRHLNERGSGAGDPGLRAAAPHEAERADPPLRLRIDQEDRLR